MIILCDTRETHPWKFDVYKGWSSKKKKLDTGDYVALGHENKICVERKASPSEISVNVGKKKDRERFERELQRAVKEYDHFYIVCEFTIAELLEFPNNLSPKAREYIKVTGRFLYKVMKDLEEQYGVKLVFCNDRKSAQDYAKSLFDRLAEEDLF